MRNILRDWPAQDCRCREWPVRDYRLPPRSHSLVFTARRRCPYKVNQDLRGLTLPTRTEHLQHLSIRLLSPARMALCHHWLAPVCRKLAKVDFRTTPTATSKHRMALWTIQFINKSMFPQRQKPARNQRHHTRPSKRDAASWKKMPRGLSVECLACLRNSRRNLDNHSLKYLLFQYTKYTNIAFTQCIVSH